MAPFLLVVLPAVLLLLPALLEVGVCARRLRQRRYLAALPHGLIGALLLVVALALAVLGGSIVHYQRLQREETVAWLTLRQIEPQRYAVRLQTADGDHRSLVLQGDHWQLDARVLRWRLPALLAGAPNLYQLERLSGRYRDVRQEQEGPRTVHDLSADAFPDLWTLKQQFPRWLGFVDADFGSSSYMPMFDHARYEVTLGPRGGLVARPVDPATAERLREAAW